jgi:hypothetical protein
MDAPFKEGERAWIELHEKKNSYFITGWGKSHTNASAWERSIFFWTLRINSGSSGCNITCQKDKLSEVPTKLPIDLGIETLRLGDEFRSRAVAVERNEEEAWIGICGVFMAPCGNHAIRRLPVLNLSRINLASQGLMRRYFRVCWSIFSFWSSSFFTALPFITGASENRGFRLGRSRPVII